MIEIGLGQTLRLASNLIMTRVLMPEAFGVIAIVVMLLQAFTLFSDIGIHRSIVRSPRGEAPHFLRVAWSVQIVRSLWIAGGVVLTGVALWLFGPRFAAPGTVYADPRLPFLIMLSSLALLFQGLISTNQWLAARKLSFKRLVAIRIGSQMLGLSVMVPLAILTHSVWALFSAMLISSLSLMVLSHLVLAGPRMRWAWDRELVAELWLFGKWLMFSSAFTFLQLNTDRIIMGGLLQADTYGFYVIAVLWANVGVMLLQKLVEQVGFNTISEVLNHRPDDLPRVLRKLQLAIDGICVTGFFGLIFLGPFVVRLLYPTKYELSAHYLIYLAPMLLTMRFRTFAALTVAHGNSRLMMLASAFNAVAVTMFLFLGFHLAGIKGALLAAAYSQFPGALLFIGWAARELKLPIARDIAWVLVILGSGVLISLTGPL